MSTATAPHPDPLERVPDDDDAPHIPAYCMACIRRLPPDEPLPMLCGAIATPADETQGSDRLCAACVRVVGRRALLLGMRYAVPACRSCGGEIVA